MIIYLLPNILSITRIVISPALLIIEPASTLFFVLYFTCGLTDVFDGVLARKLNAESKLGKTLDLIGDTVFFLATLFVLFSNFIFPTWIFAWVAGIAVLRICAWIISYRRLRFIFTHTYLDRIAGVLLFCLLPVLLLFPRTIIAICAFICFATTAASLDVLAISILMKTVSLDVRSVFQIKRLDHT